MMKKIKAKLSETKNTTGRTNWAALMKANEAKKYPADAKNARLT